MLIACLPFSPPALAENFSYEKRNDKARSDWNKVIKISDATNPWSILIDAFFVFLK